LVEGSKIKQLRLSQNIEQKYILKINAGDAIANSDKVFKDLNSFLYAALSD